MSTMPRNLYVQFLRFSRCHVHMQGDIVQLRIHMTKVGFTLLHIGTETALRLDLKLLYVFALYVQ